MSSLLSMVIVPMGYGDHVVKAAHDAGVNKAIILRARGADNSEKEGLFSIKIEPEEEIVLIAADREVTKAVCERISDEFERHSDRGGSIYILPIQNEANQ